MIDTDILIIGGGSGGFGAAIRAARVDPKARILLLDSMAQLGGTSTVGGVNVWQAGISGPGVHYELYARLAPDAIGVGKIVHLYSKEEPYGFSRIDPHSAYESTLRTAGLTKPETRRVHFEPDVMAEADAFDAERSRCRYPLPYPFYRCQRAGQPDRLNHGPTPGWRSSLYGSQ